MMCPVALWSGYPHSGECPLKSPVKICVEVSWQILFYVQFARWGIVDVVYDVLLPVVWPDMNALRVCVFFFIGLTSCVDRLAYHFGLVLLSLDTFCRCILSSCSLIWYIGCLQ